MSELNITISEQDIKIKEICGDEYEVVPYLDDLYAYPNIDGIQNMCLYLIDMEAVKDGEPDCLFADITINITTQSLKKNCVFLCNDSLNLTQWLEKNNFGRFISNRDGYDIFEFQEDVLRRLNNNVYEKYAAQFKA